MVRRRAPKGQRPKTTPKKKKAKQTQMVVRPQRNIVGTDALVHRLCAMTDPFCTAANGARWTDAIGQTATITYQSRVLTIMTANSSGYAALSFVPDFAFAGSNGYFYTQNVVTTASAAIVAPDQGDQVLQTLLGGAYTQGGRIVSAGATWWDIVPATGSGGAVIASEFASYYALSGAPGSVLDVRGTGWGNRSEVTDRRAKGSWICRPSDPTAYAFHDSTSQADKRTCLFLAPNGPASGVLIEVEMVINFEFQVSAASILNRTLKPNPVNPISTHAAKLAGVAESQMSSFIAGGKQAVTSYIHRLGQNVARASFGAVGTAIGGPAGGIIAGAIGNMAMEVD